jgi:hypothetical protein
MSGEGDKPKTEADAEFESQIREERKFTAKEALARMAGPGAMKGASPVSRVHQAETEIGTWLRSHVPDPMGALPTVLHRHLKGSELLLNALDRPLAALADCCQNILNSDYRLNELVREADVEWGQRMDERPHFQKKDEPRHPDDPYTVESVREALVAILKKLA